PALAIAGDSVREASGTRTKRLTRAGVSAGSSGRMHTRNSVVFEDKLDVGSRLAEVNAFQEDVGVGSRRRLLPTRRMSRAALISCERRGDIAAEHLHLLTEVMGPETQTDFRTQEIAYAEVLLAQGFRYCLGRLRNDLRQATSVRRGASTCVIEAFLPYQRQGEERRKLILGRLLVHDL